MDQSCTGGPLRCRSLTVRRSRGEGSVYRTGPRDAGARRCSSARREGRANLSGTWCLAAPRPRPFDDWTSWKSKRDVGDAGTGDRRGVPDFLAGGGDSGQRSGPPHSAGTARTSGPTGCRPSVRSRLLELAPTDVERAMSALTARGVGPVAVRSARTTLRIALGRAVRDGLVSRNVAALSVGPRVPGREIDYLEVAQVRAIIEATAADEYGAAWTIAATTGLRLGELLGLSFDDIDTNAGDPLGTSVARS